MPYTMTATYDPEDNKLRLRAATRLPRELYERVRAAGFIWAPRQELFVAPMWTPAREDLLLELCGGIGDEDTSLAERAEERAERFDGYRQNRERDAENARAQVAAIADNIPFGQPILVGHHSERRARRDAERIDNGMRRAVRMWETSQYWEDRAAGALRHAKYKQLPGVRARRIKKIEADRRRVVREKERAETLMAAWNSPGLNRELAELLANHSHMYRCFTLGEYPRPPEVNQYEGEMSLFRALECGIITAEQARDLIVPAYRRSLAAGARWITHYDNRLTYERAMLEEQGATALLAPKPRSAKAQLPLCNYRAPGGAVEVENLYNRGEMMRYPQVEMTKAEYAAISCDYKGTRVVEASHRVRFAMRRHTLVSVFLTDAKVNEKPAAQPKPEPVRQRKTPATSPAPATRKEAATPADNSAPFEAMRTQLAQGGTKVVAAPQLFPTPPALADQMVQRLAIQTGHTVLEPSAGTGNLLQAIRRAGVAAVQTAVEINYQMVEHLRRNFDDVRHGDFLECNGDLGTFDRIVMNPPFAAGADVKHIKHALTMLKPGGRLVALCAKGPRQQRELGALVEQLGGEWEDLPAGTFKEQGTMVSTAMIVIEKAA